MVSDSKKNSPVEVTMQFNYWRDPTLALLQPETGATAYNGLTGIQRLKTYPSIADGSETPRVLLSFGCWIQC